jgi:hypothetical protein
MAAKNKIVFLVALILQCSTYTVSGYFNTPGSCLYNIASITSAAGTTWKDSVCVNVNYPCSNAQTLIIPNNTYSNPSLNYRYDTLTVYIAGNLFINDTLKFMRCHLFMAPGALITVMNGGYLDIDSSTVTGCTNMWLGIKVLDYSELIVQEGSRVEDADTTVLVNNKAKATLQNAYINDFVLGVYMPPSINTLYNGTTLKVEHTTFDFTAYKQDYAGQNAHGTKPECGILLNDWIGTIGGNNSSSLLNYFNNLNTGIVSIGSILNVKRSKFQNINYDTFYSAAYRGTAITGVRNSVHTGKLTVLPEAWSYTTIDSSYRAVYTDGVVLTVTYVHLLNVRTGVESKNSPLLSTNMVTNCTITATHSGIFWNYNPLARFMYANDNNITINGASQGGGFFSVANSGIYMSEFSNGFVQYTASGNAIQLTNAGFGIYAGVLTNTKIKYNNITMIGNGTGISVNKNISAGVSCNVVKGNYSGGITGNSNGISAGNMNNKMLMYCNNVDSTYRGFNFGGANPNTVFRGNEINRHYVGLYLNTGTPTNPTYLGIQPHHGNKWNGPFASGFGGINLTQPSWVLFSRFDVDYNLGTVYNPIVTPSNWFQQTNGGNTFYCSNSTVCLSLPPALADTTIRELIDLGIFDSDEISEESKAIAAEYIYRELADDSALWYSDSTYIQFMYENQSEPVAYLYDAEEYLRAAYTYDSTLMALVDSCNLQITILTDSITKLEELGWSEQIEQVVYTIDFLNQTILNINIQREAIITDNLANAEYKNELVVNGELPETNTAAVNDIEIYYLETGQDKQVLIDNYGALLYIAQQCPFVGGGAVERARSMIAMINDSIIYNDDYTCLQSGIYRIGRYTVSEKINDEIIIQPNPACDYITITAKSINAENCKIEVTNNLHQVVLSKQLNCNNQERIDISKINQGLYAVKITLNNDLIKVQKLIIQR